MKCIIHLDIDPIEYGKSDQSISDSDYCLLVLEDLIKNQSGWPDRVTISVAAGPVKTKVLEL